MKKVTLVSLLALAIAGCSQHAQRPRTVSIEQASGQVEVTHNPQKVVTYDYGSLDTLVALGVGNRVIATSAAANLPPYLATHVSSLQEAGGLKTPDTAAVSTLQPDLILVTGRQNESLGKLKAIAPTLDMGITGTDYLAGVTRNVTLLGDLFGKSAEANLALAALLLKSEQARQTIAASGKRTLVLTHNDGKFGATEQPVIYSLLQAPRALPAPAPQEPGAERQRPQPLTAEAISAANPQIIFIVDRSAAIGNTPLDLNNLANSPLANSAARIVYLDPALWYLSGGGLQSLNLQLDQVLSAYR